MSLEYSLTQYDWCPYNREMSREEGDMSRVPCDEKGRGWSDTAARKEQQGLMAITRN